ncbi:glutamate synthase large subunit [Legionella sp. W05-934-2]|jgi:glutamate synthase (NADPH/NADH) large chain|uniref:glutamate synthase large subunit n=1 Tax=Legionella sp. W05-934-2 TaxID=1198649 RepID=UPI0034638479
MDQERDSCGFGLLVNVHEPPSNQIIVQALEGLARLTHRGAVSEDGLSGDGCGLLLDLDQAFFSQLAKRAKIPIHHRCVVGMCFLTPNQVESQQKRISNQLKKQDLNVSGWRLVPIDKAYLGETAAASLPAIYQFFIDSSESPWSGIELERQLFIAQKQIEWQLKEAKDFCLCSLSSKSIVYKALVLPPNLAKFYPDLQNKQWQSKVALFHQRFSTNTLSRWPLVQPFSTLAHNGEINTIRGNRVYGHQISPQLIETYYPELANLPSLLSDNVSDSLNLDQFVQAYRHFGMLTAEILRLLLPPAWENDSTLEKPIRDYYQFHFPLLPSWEGPAGLVFFDGRFAGCILDRNGFRPTRYQRSKQGLVVVGSEVGLVDIPDGDLVKQSRIPPGAMLMVDIKNNCLITEGDTPRQFYQRHPFSDWVSSLQKMLPYEEDNHAPPNHRPVLDDVKKYFDVSYEEIEQSLRFMAQNGVEPTASMGDDTPMAVLSHTPRQFFDFMRQQFAQVTNPPLDSLREKTVMSLTISLGYRAFLAKRNAQHAKQVILPSPLLSNIQFKTLCQTENAFYRPHALSLHYENQSTNLLDELEKLANKVLHQLKDKHLMLVLYDEERQSDKPSIHPALAAGYLHQTLVRHNKREQVSILVSSGWVRDAHHLAMLVATGAEGVHPWLAYRLIDKVTDDPFLARKNYRQALNKGLLKIASKMGVCTINSYHGSLLFQVIGLTSDVVKACFGDCPFAVERLDWLALTEYQNQFFINSHDRLVPTRHGGLYKYVHGGEYHDYHPDVVMTLIEACKSADKQKYREYANWVNQRKPVMLRDFYRIESDKSPIPITEVESVKTITSRFESAAMSLGALSPEAHESLAEAMNALGGRSNSGEGGEASYRHNTQKRSKIKQVASGRFGVTAEYLMQADVIQIKISQGAKPGEGGQLPGNKVNKTIAQLRYCSPGVTLISPPPHHDIYSIEDLAQLIFDLKQINPKAYVSVKLVSEPGIGTIAAGVVKAYADCITLSGYDGGTGASPLSAIRNTGCPWELGLAETQRILLENQLRHRVCLQIDGGLKTGLDVVKAALLGAETFGFGTAPMVALGCKYLRICHLNNCATGVATQQAVLRREHYQGNPERAMFFFRSVAAEVREILSYMGYPSLRSVIGRHDLLKELENCPWALPPLHPSQKDEKQRVHYYSQPRNPSFDKAPLAKALIGDTEKAFAANKIMKGRYPISNHDRSIGANIAGFIKKDPHLPIAKDVLVQLDFTGTAGQSFAVWTVDGMQLTLTGAANDYLAKGMNGGCVVLKRPMMSQIDSQNYVIAGNTCLYGATGGACFIDGRVGERFAVRNSGAHAVVAAVGYHGCEYMTGGQVTILSSPGNNFAAGMTGGIAFIWDNEQNLSTQINSETVEFAKLLSVTDDYYAQLLMHDLEQFIHHTNSDLGIQALRHLATGGRDFYVVYPKGMNLPVSHPKQVTS